MGHAPMHRNAKVGHVTELDRVVRRGKNSFREVRTYLRAINIKRRDEFNIPNMITAQIDMHKARHEIIVGRLTVILNPLHKG